MKQPKLEFLIPFLQPSRLAKELDWGFRSAIKSSLKRITVNSIVSLRWDKGLSLWCKFRCDRASGDPCNLDMLEVAITQSRAV